MIYLSLLVFFFFFFFLFGELNEKTDGPFLFCCGGSCAKTDVVILGHLLTFVSLFFRQQKERCVCLGKEVCYSLSTVDVSPTSSLLLSAAEWCV
jgi:hypothetical protein